MQIGIIGYGRLGKLISSYLAQDADLIIFDKIDFSDDINKIGARSGTLQEVCQSPIVILFVPISEFENCIGEIKDYIAPGTIVIDTCSVKEHPVSVMKEQLNGKAHILATHPMFGPDSARDTLYGTKIVLCNVSTPEESYGNIKSYLNRAGIKVIESSPEEHDKQISDSLLLTHFIGRTLLKVGAQSLEIDTKGYRRLMKILSTVENDSMQLFIDMNKYNPASKTTRQSFLDAMDSIHQELQ